jgi:hypothetical protein
LALHADRSLIYSLLAFFFQFIYFIHVSVPYVLALQLFGDRRNEDDNVLQIALAIMVR